jgi:hypothetical protein
MIVGGIAVVFSRLLWLSVELCACSVVYDCRWNCGDFQYTTKSRNSEQTSLCARYYEQGLHIDWKFWTFLAFTEQSLNITENSEHWLKFWTDSEHYEHSEQILNIMNILNIDCIFWTDSEYSEHWLNRVWTFWTLTENSEQILNILSKYIMLYFTY